MLVELPKYKLSFSTHEKAPETQFGLQSSRTLTGILKHQVFPLTDYLSQAIHTVMSESLTASISVSVKPVLISSAGGLGSFAGSPTIPYQVNYQSNQIAYLYNGVRTFSSTTDIVNLVTGATKDSFGTSITMSTLDVVHVVNNSNQAITVSGGASSAFGSSPTWVIQPGKCFYTDGSYPLSSGGAQSLQFSVPSSGASYSLIAIGS